MKIRTIYIADDGEEFDSKEECKAHEELIASPSSESLLMADKDLNVVKNTGNNVESKAYYIQIKNQKAIDWLAWVSEEWGCSVPNKIGCFYYVDGWSEDGWNDIQEKFDAVKKIKEIFKLKNK